MGINRVLSFFEKQQGLSNDCTYDFALGRLRVAVEDSWNGVQPSYYGSDFNPAPPIFAAKFAQLQNYSHIVALASEDGKIALQNVNKKNHDAPEMALEGQQCHYNAVFDVAWDPGQMKLISASGDHTARLWDVSETGLRYYRVFNGHTRSVKTAVFRKDDSAVFATGGRDGAILIWDTRSVPQQPKADNFILQGHPGPSRIPATTRKRNKVLLSSNPSSITGLVFQDDNTLISCGAGDGVIKIWDLRRNYKTYRGDPLPKHSIPHAGRSTFKGFTNLLIDKGGTKLYANCMDSTIYCYNLSSYSEVPYKRYVGLRNGTFYIKSCLSPDGNYLISGSSDDKAYIWNLNDSQPLVTLNGHFVEVTCVAWSGLDETCIVTCSDDARHKIWRIGKEKIDLDDQLSYTGNAEFYKTNNAFKLNKENKLLDTLGSTPNTMKRFIEQNEKTPSTSKRTFNEMNENDYVDVEGNGCKRPVSGRILFKPQMKCDAIDDGVSFVEGNLDIPNKNNINQENSPKTTHVQRPSIKTIDASKTLSPLSERSMPNLNSPEPSCSNSSVLQHPPSTSTTASAAAALLSSPITFSSPTSNLPNYVVDGDAPHLHIMSPKRKTKNNMDWLTKIRKRKLSTNGRLTLREKLHSHCADDDYQDIESETADVLTNNRISSSPLPSSDDLRISNMIYSSPKNRSTSGSSSTDVTAMHQHNYHQQPQHQQKTVSTTSILRYLISSPSSQLKQNPNSNKISGKTATDVSN